MASIGITNLLISAIQIESNTVSTLIHSIKYNYFNLIPQLWQYKLSEEELTLHPGQSPIPS